MIVTCPACSTKYDLPDSSLTGAGRNVRCARCGHQWYLEAVAPAAPPEDEFSEETVAAVDQPEAEAEPEPLADEAAEEAAEATEEEGAEAEEAAAEPEEEAEDPWERRTRRAAEGELPPAINRAPTMPDPAAAANNNAGGRKVAGWLVFLAIVGGSVAGAHYGKDDIIDALPQAQPFYEMVGYSFSGPLDGLDLPEVRSTRQLENGSSVLIVEGTVSNSSDENKRVPMLKAELLDEAGVAISSWTFTPDLSVVRANGEMPFREVVVDPDPRANNVAVSFADEASQ